MNAEADIANDQSSRFAPASIWTAFEGYKLIASGDPEEVMRRMKDVIARGEVAPVLIFDNTSSELIEVDFRGTVEQALAKLPRARETPAPDTSISDAPKRAPGRPRLGVVPREVTLLPRHWAWLNGQPGGASVALRKLVEEARRASHWKDRARQSQDAVYRFMSVMAGNLSGYEEALRAFYGRDYERLDELIQEWPADVRDHVRKLVAVAERDAAIALGNAEAPPTQG